MARLCTLLLFTQPYDAVLEENRSVYDAYLTAAEGPLAQEKRTALEAEMERLNAVHLEIELLWLTAGVLLLMTLLLPLEKNAEPK